MTDEVTLDDVTPIIVPDNYSFVLLGPNGDVTQVLKRGRLSDVYSLARDAGELGMLYVMHEGFVYHIIDENARLFDLICTGSECRVYAYILKRDPGSFNFLDEEDHDHPVPNVSVNEENLGETGKCQGHDEEHHDEDEDESTQDMA